MENETLKIEGFGTLRYKKLTDAELVTTLEELAAKSERLSHRRGWGYIRGLIRQEILFRMKNHVR